MFETLRQLISIGGYRLDDMLLRIDTMYASGQLDAARAVRRYQWGLAA